MVTIMRRIRVLQFLRLLARSTGGQKVGHARPASDETGVPGLKNQEQVAWARIATARSAAENFAYHHAAKLALRDRFAGAGS